jgi:hypothetical protein
MKAIVKAYSRSKQIMCTLIFPLILHHGLVPAWPCEGPKQSNLMSKKKSTFSKVASGFFTNQKM